MNRSLRTLIVLAATLLSLAATLPTAAQEVFRSQYFYDDKGRLTKVVDQDGNVAEYVYDRAGNILEIKRSTVTLELIIFNFAPEQGPPGTNVTINGQGFSPDPSGTTVKFNGALAGVLSASKTRLVVTVPVGATSGTISVTVGVKTIQTDHAFNVFAAPAITAVSPKFVERSASLLSRVDGTDLIGSSFTFLPESTPPKITVTSASIEPTGTSAILNLAVDGSALGQFTIVATSTSGSSATTPTKANSFVLVPSGSTDIDGDGLSNDDETRGGTDPRNPDTDGDGFSDGLEVGFGSNPLDRNSIPDLSDPTRESFGMFLSIKNLLSPAGAEPKEAVAPSFSVKNLVAPPGIDPQETVCQAFSVRNLISPPAAGTEPKEAVGLTFSLRNPTSPAGPAPNEAAGLTFSLRNAQPPSPQIKSQNK